MRDKVDKPIIILCMTSRELDTSIAFLSSRHLTEFQVRGAIDDTVKPVLRGHSREGQKVAA